MKIQLVKPVCIGHYVFWVTCLRVQILFIKTVCCGSYNIMVTNLWTWYAFNVMETYQPKKWSKILGKEGKVISTYSNAMSAVTSHHQKLFSHDTHIMFMKETRFPVINVNTRQLENRTLTQIHKCITQHPPPLVTSVIIQPPQKETYQHTKTVKE